MSKIESKIITKEKYMPKVGEAFYSRRITGSYYIDICKDPWTVVEVNKTGTQFIAQEPLMIFKGKRFYDTLPDNIVPDVKGRKITFKWSKAKHRWQHAEYTGDKYPDIACWGEGYRYQPYLD